MDIKVRVGIGHHLSCHPHDVGAYEIKLGARYYNPGIGRFTQPDTSAQETNNYVYAGANPITNSDPSGLCFSWLYFGECGFTDWGDNPLADLENATDVDTYASPEETHALTQCGIWSLSGLVGGGVVGLLGCGQGFFSYLEGSGD